MKDTARTVFAALFAFGALCALVPASFAAALGLAPHLQTKHLRLAQAGSFIHFGLVGWLAAVVFGLLALSLARGRWPWLLVGPSVAGLLLQASWVAPYYVANDRQQNPAFELSVINVEFGADNPQELWDRVAGSDVVVLVEADETTVTRLGEQGFQRDFPYRAGRGGADLVSGTVIYSRFPFEDLGQGPTAFESRLVRLKTPTGSVMLAGVHPVNPMNGSDAWVKDANALHSWLQPQLGEPLVVAGDFNAIDRHATMQPWWEAGFRSSAEVAGAGLQRTWPQGGRDHTPTALIGIDHVLVSPRLSAAEHRLFTLSDSDHAGIRTRIGRRP